MIAAQVGIATLGVAAVYLSQDTRPRRRWGPVLGLVAQPFWFVETVSAEQWGMVAICVLYTLVWSSGVYSQWWKARAA